MSWQQSIRQSAAIDSNHNSGGQGSQEKMTTMRCAVCATGEHLQVCSNCQNVAYCGKEHQTQHWNLTHKKYCKYIPGTKVKRDTEMGRDPLHPSVSMDRRWGSGHSLRDPVATFSHFKIQRDGSRRVRMCFPGKLTPYIMNATRAEERARGFNRAENVSTPYTEDGDKKVKLPYGKHRHIASFTLKELRKLNWDGAMTVSRTLDGECVPFVCGYDSDPQDEYEQVDMAAAKRRGIIGLSPDMGLFMEVPQRGVTKLNERLRRSPS
jgi:hypothetical protein